MYNNKSFGLISLLYPRLIASVRSRYIEGWESSIALIISAILTPLSSKYRALRRAPTLRTLATILGNFKWLQKINFNKL
jgi:hypothetical protein